MGMRSSARCCRERGGISGLAWSPGIDPTLNGVCLRGDQAMEVITTTQTPSPLLGAGWSDPLEDEMRATPGRPGEGSLRLVHRSDFRLPGIIATSFSRVLRTPLETALATGVVEQENRTRAWIGRCADFFSASGVVPGVPPRDAMPRRLLRRVQIRSVPSPSAARSSQIRGRSQLQSPKVPPRVVASTGHCGGRARP